MSDTSSSKIKRIFIWLLCGVLGFFSLVVLAAAVVLKNGFHLDHVAIGPAAISDFNLIWHDKLEVQVDTIVIKKESNEKRDTDDAHFVSKTVDAVHGFARFFSLFSIKDLVIGEKSIAVSLHQGEEQEYVLDLRTPDVTFQSRLSFDGDDLVVDIVEAESVRFASSVKGQVRLDGASDKVTGAISARINDSFPVSLDFTADNEQISFTGKEAGKITTITPLVDLFGLKHSIQRWITDYLSGSRYHLISFKGQLPWDNPKAILDTLEAEVRVDDTEYTFAQGLEPIKAKDTDVYFRKGVLIIKPHEATFYGQDAGESWVDINFNDPKNIFLTAYIKTRAVANDDILTLLNHYKIPLPFKQIEGKTATDLELVVNFRTKKVEAEGVFEIDKGVIHYGTKNYSVKDTRIKLVNTDVTIDRLKVGYEDLFTAQIKGNIQAKKKSGDLNIVLEEVSLKIGDSLLALDTSTPGPKMNYHFDPKGNMLDVHPSLWNFDSLKINLGDFRAPVNTKELSVELPKVRLDTPLGILSEISGYISIKKKKADIICDILKYHVKDLELITPHLEVDIAYDNDLTIKTAETAMWRLSNVPVSLYPSEFDYGDNVLTVTKSRIRYGDFFESYVAGHFNKQLVRGEFTLQKIDITDENLEKSLVVGSETHVVVSGTKGKYEILFPEFKMKIETDKEKNWSASFGDLSAIYPRSKRLQRYKIKEGSVVVSSVNGKKPYKFSADIKLPYQLLVEDDKLIDQVQVTGRIADEGVFATVNKALDIEYADKNLAINSSGIGYNITEINKLLREYTQSSRQGEKGPAEGKPFSLSLKAEKSQVYLSPKSRVIADEINLEFQGGILSMQLDHGPGHIQLKTQDGSFTFDGANLNDQFMGALIQKSSFQGGKMSIVSSGSFEDFSAIFTIEDTVWGKMALLNNVMALLNTVPALMTFSLPEYSTEGLPIDSAVVGMKYTKKVATIESMVIKSAEVSTKGAGTIDFSKREIDLDIFLKTQSSTNVGKIPLAGYVLAGDDDDESLGLKITGGFDDPKVTNTLAKEIVAYPVEVLYRTLKLPFHLFEKQKSNSGEE